MDVIETVKIEAEKAIGLKLDEIVDKIKQLMIK